MKLTCLSLCYTLLYGHVIILSTLIGCEVVGKLTGEKSLVFVPLLVRAAAHT